MRLYGCISTEVAVLALVTSHSSICLGLLANEQAKESERIIFSGRYLRTQKAMDALAKYSIERKLAGDFTRRL